MCAAAVTQTAAGLACFASLPFTLCMLLRYDNIAVRYITPAHGVYHSGRHFMLHNHPIYISLCIKVFTHGLVKSALPHYQRTPAEGKRHSGSSDCHPHWCESPKNMRPSPPPFAVLESCQTKLDIVPSD